MKKVSDYIVEFLISKQVTDVFGYPGGMVTHLIDSFSKYEKFISNHINYHEQASSFSACGYAQAKCDVGVAYATSGPGATNLITGICNAYFDSIPTIFITGQVNTQEANAGGKCRQKGFQETDIISIVSKITKYCKYIDNPNDIKYYLEKAYYMANTGRKGPVLLDIPMNILRSEIDTTKLKGYSEEIIIRDIKLDKLYKMLKKSKRPCILAGNGIKISDSVENFKELTIQMNIPVVTSMLSVDILKKEDPLNFGFIGAYGDRTANFIIAKSDLIISFGSRMDIRQIGSKIESFAPDAKLIRIDIDNNELNNTIKKDQLSINADVKIVIEKLLNMEFQYNDNSEWIKTCNIIKSSLSVYDDTRINKLINRISMFVPDNRVITTDVGQNQVWIAQSFNFKENQKVLFSGGHGAMGYSLPAAIGAYYATKLPVVCFSGDGGIQMNIQELQFIKENRIPIIIIIFNNHALGMIRHFQEMYFNGNYSKTIDGNGYSAPNFKLLAKAYDIEYKKINYNTRISSEIIGNNSKIIEIDINEDTYVYPKLEFGKPNQDQEPLIDRELYQKLMKL